MLNGLDLFSGIGGITVGLKYWVRPVVYCEIERYAQAVLMSRMQSGDIPYAPIWDNVTTLTKSTIDSIGIDRIDIIYGGFPCQDLSYAGLGAGLAGERSGLFFEIVRLIDELRPSFVFLENVPAIVTRGLDTVAGAVTALGYDCRWTIISAGELGAPHLRERWWLLAHAGQVGPKSGQSRRSLPWLSMVGTEQMANSDKIRCDANGNENAQRIEQISQHCVFSAGIHTEAISCITSGIDIISRKEWQTEPDVGRVANGIPCAMDRIAGLGNAVVPQCVEEAFKRLMGNLI